MRKPWAVLVLAGLLSACGKGSDKAEKATFDEAQFEHGATLFTRNCSTCHDLSGGSMRAGPMLGGLGGRQAGSVKGFAYSAALKNSSIVWNEETLDRWLSGPQAFVPGTIMQIQPITDPEARRALITYLLNQ